MSFVDSAVITVRGGHGGRGSASLRREPFTPRGGPDGGDGGRGGSVVLVADRSLDSLAPYVRKRSWRAPDGEPGAGGRKDGKRGDDVVLQVPVGTQVVDDATGEVLGDLDQEGARHVAAAGGVGGRGNVHFKSPTNRTPRHAEPGLKGEERRLRLELKLIADVALVGPPNAGKSSLLRAISAARPKVADYPFTTLAPELGVVEGGALRFVVADIPGLIEGASAGAGLGLRFLRHVERTRLLVEVVDGALSDPWNQVELVRKELASYSQSLAERPSLVAVNKVDLPDVRRLRQGAAGAYFISARTGEGVSELLSAIEEKLASLPAPVRAPVMRPVRLRPRRAAAQPLVQRRAWGFELGGDSVRRLVERTDFESADSLQRFQVQLDRIGATRALADAGAEAGDTVRVGELEFEYQP